MTVTPGNTRHLRAGGDPAEVRGRGNKQLPLDSRCHGNDSNTKETPVISAQAEIQRKFEREALNKYCWIPIAAGMTVTPGNTRHLRAGGDPAEVRGRGNKQIPLDPRCRGNDSNTRKHPSSPRRRRSSGS